MSAPSPHLLPIDKRRCAARLLWIRRLRNIGFEKGICGFEGLVGGFKRGPYEGTINDGPEQPKDKRSPDHHAGARGQIRHQNFVHVIQH